MLRSQNTAGKQLKSKLPTGLAVCRGELVRRAEVRRCMCNVPIAEDQAHAHPIGISTDGASPRRIYGYPDLISITLAQGHG